MTSNEAAERPSLESRVNKVLSVSYVGSGTVAELKYLVRDLWENLQAHPQQPTPACGDVVERYLPAVKAPAGYTMIDALDDIMAMLRIPGRIDKSAMDSISWLWKIKAALAAMGHPDLIRQQFDAIGKVNIPTREKMGLPALSEDEAVRIMWDEVGGIVSIGHLQIAYRALMAAIKGGAA